MAALRAKEAPRFKGKYLMDFLDKFEILAKVAGISNAECCDYLARYCCHDKLGFDHKRFIKRLKEYLETDWKKLNPCLMKCYPPKKEEFSITKKALVKFIQQNRNIHDLASFDKYYRNFGLLTNALEVKKKLNEDERNSLFIHGILYSLHKKIDELLHTNDCKNKDIAPEMDKVINAAEELLKIGQFNFKNMNAYVNYKQESEESSNSPDEEESTQSSESEEDNIRKITSHCRHTRKEKIPKTEFKMENRQPKMQMDKAIDDINQHLDHLTIALECQTKEIGKTSKSPSPSTNQSSSSWVCYMCGKPKVHMIKECPNTIQFMAAGVIKLNDKGCIVRANSTALPWGIPSRGGIAKILKEEIMHKKSTMPNLETDQNAFLVANYEYTHFDMMDTEYEVMPALRSTKTYEEECTQPYKRQDATDSKKPTSRMKLEVVIQTPKPKPYVKVPVPPRILKCTEEILKKEIPSEDVEMKDEFRPSAGKQKAVDSSSTNNLAS